jgi:hypothetical protein
MEKNSSFYKFAILSITMLLCFKASAEIEGPNSDPSAENTEKISKVARTGSPPGSTDDPYIPAVGGSETNFDHTCERGKTSQVCYVNIDSNVGVRVFGKAVQIKVEIPYISNQKTDEEGNSTRLHGWGKVLFGVKIPLIGDEDSRWAISVYPQYESILPGNKSEKREVVEPGRHAILPAIFAYNGNVITALFNVGVDHHLNPAPDVVNPDRLDKRFAAGINVTNNLSMMAETGKSSALKKLNTDVERSAGLGGMYRVNDRLNVYALFSKIRNSDGTTKAVKVGLQFTTDPKPQNENYYNFFGPKKEPVQAILLNAPADNTATTEK